MDKLSAAPSVQAQYCHQLRDDDGWVESIRDGAVRLSMQLANKSQADQSNLDFFHGENLITYHTPILFESFDHSRYL
jgi:hypothetical protein